MRKYHLFKLMRLKDFPEKRHASGRKLELKNTKFCIVRGK